MLKKRTWFLIAAFTISIGLAIVFPVPGPVQSKPSPPITPVMIQAATKPPYVPTTDELLADFIKSRNSRVPRELAAVMSKDIVKAAKKKQLPLELLVGLIEAETIPPFNPMSVSDAGAKGLMQILEGETVTIDPDKAFDIAYNLDIGTEILRGKISIAKGDLGVALANYSGGAKGYSETVLACMGRYMLYRYETEKPRL